MLRTALLSSVVLLGACDPFASWPDPTDVFPWRYTPETDLPPYATVRVETETWIPLVDLEETALYVQKSVLHKASAPYEERVHFGLVRPQIPLLAPRDARMSFVGDIMRFDGNWAGFATGVADRLEGVRVGNLETPVSREHPTDPDELAQAFGIYAFNSPPELVAGLPLDVVQINNNHSLDLGDRGLELTHEEVAASGRVPIGMDENLAWVDAAGASSGSEVRVAVLSYTWGLNVPVASAHDLHVIPFGHLDEEIDLAPVRREVRAARAEGATHVVLLLHWGFEYEYFPDPHFLQLGREIVSLGADLVVGSGPHVVEPAEICDVNRPRAAPGLGRCSVRDLDDPRQRTAAILYSLGDFGTDLATVPLQVGLVATASLRPGAGVTGLAWEAVASTNAPGSGQVLVPLADLTADPIYAAEAARLDALLGTSWKRTR